MILRPPISTRTYTLFPTRRSAVLQEVRSPDLVARQLESWGVEVHRGLGITGHGEGPCMLHNAAYDFNDELIRSEEHTSELQSLMRISYADFCLKKKKNDKDTINQHCRYKLTQQ